jgi:hypothetical protein
MGKECFQLHPMSQYYSNTKTGHTQEGKLYTNFLDEHRHKNSQ